MKNVQISAFEPTKDEYIGTVYGSAALVTVAGIVMADAFDNMEEHTDYLKDRRMYKASRAAEIYMDTARRNTVAVLVNKEDGAWMSDFGLATHSVIEDDLRKLRTAIANGLGRCKAVEHPTAVASLLVAQTLASEAASYAERRANKFRGCMVENRHGSMVSVGNLLRAMSCRDADTQLRFMARRILEPRLPDGFDMLEAPNVRLGCKIVLNKLADVDTWITAREKADELNNRKEKRKDDIQ